MPKSPAQRLLDVALYAPLGVGLAVAEAFPEFARKGRARLEPQFGVARVVGGMAVQQGYRQFVRLAGTLAGNGVALLRRPHGPSSAGGVNNATDLSSARRAKGSPSPEDLTIPSYDSLSAIQVVQRLEGLSRDEVAAIRDYEVATRARRTILSKAEQLLARA